MDTHDISTSRAPDHRPTVEAAFERAVEWGILRYGDELGFPSGLTLESLGESLSNMSSFDSEDILGTSCFMEPNMDAIFQQSINDVKHDEERRAYLERCLAQVFRMDNIMDGIRDMMDDELKLYGVAETKWKRKTVLDKIKLLVDFRLCNDIKNEPKLGDYDQNPGKYEFEVGLWTLCDSSPIPTIWERSRLFFSWETTFDEFLRTLQEATMMSNINAVSPSDDEEKRYRALGSDSVENQSFKPEAGACSETSLEQGRQDEQEIVGEPVTQDEPDFEVEPNLDVAAWERKKRKLDAILDDYDAADSSDEALSLETRHPSTTPVALIPTILTTIVAGSTLPPPLAAQKLQILKRKSPQDISKTAPRFLSQPLPKLGSLIDGGYTLHEGPWLYGISLSSGGAPSWNEITNEEDYQVMLRALRRKNIPSVLVRHSKERDRYNQWVHNEKLRRRDEQAESSAGRIGNESDWKQFDHFKWDSEPYMGVFQKQMAQNQVNRNAWKTDIFF
ncbi:hypothetical protein B0O99DRAFT_624119 [Bisporella sp. PMI_857]|nr:hypothetical protein B0O99DRAFT_624119 [Bisporella sp. PMI_857]